MCDFFSHGQLYSKALKVGFVKRKSKLKPWMFIEAVIFQFQSQKETSLLSLVGDIFSRFGIRVKRQSLNERFNQYSISFIKELLKDALNKTIFKSYDRDIFNSFSSVFLKDSTVFGLPANMSIKFPGNIKGEALAHIQFEYDLKSGIVKELALGSHKVNDYKNAKETTDEVEKGSLLIRDLGYISIDVLREIVKKEAFFLNRIKPNTSIFEIKSGKYVKLSLKSIQKSLRKSHKQFIEKEVFIGNRKYLPCRVVFFLVPEDKVQERKRKQQRKSQQRCANKTDKSVLDYADLNIFITNANTEALPSQQILKVYKLRWQIELMFKCWKQIAKINKLKDAKPERIETMIYAKLLWIIINWSIINLLSSYFFKTTGYTLSLLKSFKTMRERTFEFRLVLCSVNQLKMFLLKLKELFSKEHFTEKRKGKVYSVETLKLFMEN